MNIRILFIGDVVGAPGRMMVQKHLPALRQKYSVDVVILNGENSADGRGITPKIMESFKHMKVQVVTSGNHIWDKKDIVPYLQTNNDLLRPVNFPSTCPGIGLTMIPVKDQSLAVINVQGRIFMKEHLECPFRAVESLLTYLRDKTKNIFIDFHAETTSEKACFAYYFDGHVSCIVGTHTHVQTADERILSHGTAFITDVGMVGALNSSLGMKKDAIIHQFLTQMPVRFQVEMEGPILLNAVIVDIDTHTGKAIHIERISIIDHDLHIDQKD